MKIIFILLILLLPFGVSGQTCDTLIESKSNNIILKESFYASSCKKKSYQWVKTDHTQKWDIRKKEISWDENGKVISKTKTKSKTGGDWGQITESVIWTFKSNGKFCIKKKKVKAVRLH